MIPFTSFFYGWCSGIVLGFTLFAFGQMFHVAEKVTFE